MKHPLQFSPRYVEKVWGGRHLAQLLGPMPPSREPIGEVWLAGNDNAIVSDGSRTLGALLGSDGPELVGTSFEGFYNGSFPLLIKFLDTAEHLSVQVHPDDAYARLHHGEPYGKCEMWYVLQADPGAFVYHGLRRALTKEALQLAMQDGTLVDELQQVAVKPGDVLINHPGTVHALGAGLLVYELQQSCDLTYRMYDWGRPDRGLHVEHAAEVTDRQPHLSHIIEQIALDGSEYTRTLLTASNYFAAELVSARANVLVPLMSDRWEVWTVLSGTGSFRLEPDGVPQLLSPGMTYLLPVGWDRVSLGPETGQLDIVRAYVPDMRRDIIDPLRKQGVPDERILLLGGDALRSHIRP